MGYRGLAAYVSAMGSEAAVAALVASVAAASVLGTLRLILLSHHKALALLLIELEFGDSGSFG
jgi:hypothetical protein